MLRLTLVVLITTDRVTNDKTYGDWTADNGDSFTSVTSPVIDGYTADQLKVSEMTGITVDTEDISVTVTYTRNQGTIDVTYIDETTGKFVIQGIKFRNILADAGEPQLNVKRYKDGVTTDLEAAEIKKVGN